MHLAVVSKVYWEAHDDGLEKVIGNECGGWYGYLAKFLVLSEEQAACSNVTWLGEVLEAGRPEKHVRGKRHNFEEHSIPLILTFPT